MSLDTKMRSTASRLVNKFGKSVEIAQTIKTYDPTSGENTGVVTTTVPVKAVIAAFEVGFKGTTEVLVGDLRVTIAAADMTGRPAPGDTVKIDGQTYRAVNAIPTYVSEMIAIWDLQVRK